MGCRWGCVQVSSSGPGLPGRWLLAFMVEFSRFHNILPQRLVVRTAGFQIEFKLSVEQDFEIMKVFA